MAGSWNHTVDRETGKLLAPRDVQGMLECVSGDVSEYVEDVYGMVWWLATELAEAKGDRYEMGLTAAEYIAEAHAQSDVGMKRSPGIAEEGALEDGEPEWDPPRGQWVVAGGPSVSSQLLARVVKRVSLSFDTYGIYLWDHDKLRLGKTLETYHLRFLRPATTADLNRYRVPEEDR